jgi:imidazolonepropionase-like amidohydrolase
MAETASTLAIIVDRLIDGTGRDPVEAAVCIVEDGTISAAGPRRSVDIPSSARVVEGEDLTLLPGLMDMHVHLGMPAGVDFSRMLMTQRSLNLLYAVPNSAATLRAGITTARDAGLAPASVRVAVDRGLFPGPRLRMAVSILGQTGGHADSTMPCGCVLPFGSEMDVPDGVVDGAEAMRRRVREGLRAGADWIKLCTSGGVLSTGDEVDVAQLTVEEISVAVEEAAAVGKRCLAHAMSPRGIRNAVIAGVASIEHGCLLDEEGIELMRQHGTYLVPTLVAPGDVIANAERTPGSIPDALVEKARQVMTRHRTAFRAAVEAGVLVAMGTDTGVGPHGANLRELPLMVECGMTPMQAIVASTRSCAELLGLSASVGTLTAGKAADLVAVAGDPLADIRVIADPARVRLVVKGGALVRDETAAATAVAV